MLLPGVTVVSVGEIMLFVTVNDIYFLSLKLFFKIRLDSTRKFILDVSQQNVEN